MGVGLNGKTKCEWKITLGIMFKRIHDDDIKEKKRSLFLDQSKKRKMVKNEDHDFEVQVIAEVDFYKFEP